MLDFGQPYAMGRKRQQTNDQGRKEVSKILQAVRQYCVHRESGRSGAAAPRGLSLHYWTSTAGTNITQERNKTNQVEASLTLVNGLSSSVIRNSLEDV